MISLFFSVREQGWVQQARLIILLLVGVINYNLAKEYGRSRFKWVMAGITTTIFATMFTSYYGYYSSYSSPEVWSLCGIITSFIPTIILVQLGDTNAPKTDKQILKQEISKLEKEIEQEKNDN